jgi:hypothetical protein
MFPDGESILASARKRPAVIHRNEEILSSVTDSDDSQMVETEKGKYVVRTTVVTTTTRYTVVREFDPNASYQDAITDLQ